MNKLHDVDAFKMWEIVFNPHQALSVVAQPTFGAGLFVVGGMAVLCLAGYLASSLTSSL